MQQMKNHKNVLTSSYKDLNEINYLKEFRSENHVIVIIDDTDDTKDVEL
jgi:hypothetical protein